MGIIFPGFIFFSYPLPIGNSVIKKWFEIVLQPFIIIIFNILTKSLYKCIPITHSSLWLFDKWTDFTVSISTNLFISSKIIASHFSSLITFFNSKTSRADTSSNLFNWFNDKTGGLKQGDGSLFYTLKILFIVNSVNLDTCFKEFPSSSFKHF